MNNKLEIMTNIITKCIFMKDYWNFVNIILWIDDAVKKAIGIEF